MILVIQQCAPVVSIAPYGFEDPMAGRMWIDGIDSVLVEGWEETPGCNGAYPAVYRLVSTAMVIYDDPFCQECKERDPDCVCWQGDLPHQWRRMDLGPEEPESWVCRWCGRMWTAEYYGRKLRPPMDEVCHDRSEQARRSA